jgi:large subunit ribosomal protein L23
MSDSFIIKKPWVTEKSGDLAAKGKYVFIVSKEASKPEIKKAMKEIYKVDATDVNMVNLPGKRKRFGQAMKGMTEGHRKAIVTLKEGQKIDIQ